MPATPERLANHHQTAMLKRRYPPPGRQQLAFYQTAMLKFFN
jgi:hypothetical protein